MVTRLDYPEGSMIVGDCLEVMASLPEKSVDLVFGSPPYEDARLYLENGEDLGIARDTEEWVAWMIEVFKASLRVCKGLVAYVVGHGKGSMTWSAAPALLLADLHRAGINLRSPAWYHRNGIMGGGGPDWLRPDLEFIVCATDGRMRLPWSDNTACGHPPKYGPGGAPSYREKDGKRTSRGRSITTEERRKMQALMAKEGISTKQAALRLGIGQHRFLNSSGACKKEGIEGGAKVSSGVYVPPEKANPGNVITCGSVGGGKLGSNVAHDNEAPFPEKLADFFIRSFCPPGGVVLDPFGGSGTTMACAVKTGRKFITCDLRESQVKLMRRRYKQALARKGFGL